MLILPVITSGVAGRFAASGRKIAQFRGTFETFRPEIRAAGDRNRASIAVAGGISVFGEVSGI